MTEWILGIDTSTDVCVGLARREGGAPERVGAWRIDDRRAHAEHLQTLIDTACAEQGITVRDIARVAVGLGPGPYTGLRVGIVTARTLAALGGAGFPASLAEPKGVCSLDIVARQVALSDADLPDGFVAATDARRKELYWARYDAAGVRQGDAQVSAAAELPDLPVVGPGSTLYPEAIGARALDLARQLDAGVLAAGVDDLPDAGIEPLYLRKPDATVPTTRKSALVPPRLSVRR